MKAPNPGSAEAVALGCTCPRIDNGYGQGAMGGRRNERGNRMFFVTPSCPIHGHVYEEADARA